MSFAANKLTAMFLVLATGAGLAAASPAAAQPERCIPDWSVATPIVRKEGLIAVEQLGPLARSRAAGEIVNTTLCLEKGRYVYRILLKGGGGPLKSMTVDARRPFER